MWSFSPALWIKLLYCYYLLLAITPLVYVTPASGSSLIMPHQYRQTACHENSANYTSCIDVEHSTADSNLMMFAETQTLYQENVADSTTWFFTVGTMAGSKPQYRQTACRESSANYTSCIHMEHSTANSSLLIFPETQTMYEENLVKFFDYFYAVDIMAGSKASYRQTARNGSSASSSSGSDFKIT